MQDFISKGCIFFCLIGGVYAVWMLRDCHRQFQENKRGGHPPRWNWQVDWITQVMAAGMFLIVAGTILAKVAPKQIEAMRAGDPAEPIEVCSVQINGMCPLPPRRLHYESDRPGKPIVGVDLSALPVINADVRALLKSAPEIQWLNLNGTKVTDEIIGEIAGMPHLMELCLANTTISDAGLAQLAAAEKLQVLILAGTPVTDEGVDHLRKLTVLRKLNLQRTGITDACSKTLCRLLQLEDLRIYETAMTADGYEQVCLALPGLSWTEFWAEKLRVRD